jgi:hypothetical protein
MVARKTTRPRVRRANAKNLRKTTRKGAYKKGAKRNFQVRRAPFVETKKQTDMLVALKAKVPLLGNQDTIRRTVEPLVIENGSVDGMGNINPNCLTVFPLNSFLNMNTGLENSDMIGRSVFSKYLKAKLTIEIPYGQRVIKHPADLYIVHGFITVPIANTLHSDPTTLLTTRTHVNNHITEQLQQYFNQRKDKLDFPTKSRRNIKILGYRKVKPNLNNNLGGQATLTQYPNQQGGIVNDSVGAPPLVNMTCNWPMMRKTQYELGLDEIGGDDALQHNFPNYSWLPFMAMYNPTAATFKGATYVSQYEPKFTVRYNSCHYFTDS